MLGCLCWTKTVSHYAGLFVLNQVGCQLPFCLCWTRETVSHGTGLFVLKQTDRQSPCGAACVEAFRPSSTKQDCLRGRYQAVHHHSKLVVVTHLGSFSVPRQHAYLRSCLPPIPSGEVHPSSPCQHQVPRPRCQSGKVCWLLDIDVHKLLPYVIFMCTGNVSKAARHFKKWIPTCDCKSYLSGQNCMIELPWTNDLVAFGCVMTWWFK